MEPNLIQSNKFRKYSRSELEVGVHKVTPEFRDLTTLNASPILPHIFSPT